MPVSISGMRNSTSIAVAQGGTGNNTLQSGSLLVGNDAGAIAVLPPGSEGQVLTVVDGEWAAADASGGPGGGLSTVNTSGNLSGDGSSGNPVTLKSNISLTSVTASFSGSGAALTNLTASQIAGLNNAIDARITNIPNAALQNSSITFNGETIPLGGTYNVYIPGAADFTSIDYTLETFTALSGSGIAVGNVVAFSGSLVCADYSDVLKSNAVGIVREVNGNQITIKVAGQTTATSASLYSIGTPVYVGPSGSLVDYSSIPSGKNITQAGFVCDTGKIIVQPRVFGIKA